MKEFVLQEPEPRARIRFRFFLGQNDTIRAVPVPQHQYSVCDQDAPASVSVLK